MKKSNPSENEERVHLSVKDNTAYFVPYQVAEYQKKIKSLEEEIKNLISIGKENESIWENTCQLTEELLKSQTDLNFFETTERKIREHFNLSIVAIRVLKKYLSNYHLEHLLTRHCEADPELAKGKAEAIQNLNLDCHAAFHAARNDGGLRSYHLDIQQKFILEAEEEKKILTLLDDSFSPLCGKVETIKLQELFRSFSFMDGSSAIVPLMDDEKNFLGILVLGDKNPEKFFPEMGTVFLTFLSRILSHLIGLRLMKKNEPCADR